MSLESQEKIQIEEKAAAEAPELTRSAPLRAWRIRPGGVLGYVAIAFFALNIVLLIATVVINSFSGGWFGTFLPDKFTNRYYGSAAQEHDIPGLIIFTLAVAAGVVIIAGLIGLPTAYVLARRQFRGKPLIWALFLIPMMIPPMTYGIPLATTMYRFDLANTVIGVTLVNLVPIVPFVILILTPFIEQIDVNLESAARMLGASRMQIFRRVIAPLMIPGLLTAGILAAVRTIASFELTFLVSGASTQTLIVAVYNDAYGAGNRPVQQIDAMAVIYTTTTMLLLIIALIFVSPTQFVFRLKR